MTRAPDFRELVGDDPPLSPAEEEHLRRAHDLLASVGPPPELSPELAAAPTEMRTRKPDLFPPRRLGAALVLAAALALAAFGGGYLAGHRARGPEFTTAFTVPLHGTGTASLARASLQVGRRDAIGNWPLRMSVRGLRPLHSGRWYELYLTRGKGERLSCGTFNVHSGTTTVRLNAPYRLNRSGGWIVVAHSSPEESGRVLLTTA